MGRFDGPHFRTDQNIVSIWVASCRYEELPDDYFEENYEEDDEEPFNQFSSDFGFGYYDHDGVEGNRRDDGSQCAVAELLEDVSFSESFSGAAVECAASIGREDTCYVYLIFNFKYDPLVAQAKGSRFMEFVGAFPFRTRDL